MKEYFVYIGRCRDNAYYTGITNNVERRIAEHNDVIDPHCFTYKRRPVELVYQCSFREVSDAIAAEKQIKGWSRAKKEALIRGETDQLPLLAACQNETHHRNHQSVMVSASTELSTGSDEP